MISIPPTRAMSAPQLRTTRCASGPLTVSPKFDWRAASGVIAACTIVAVRTPEKSMIQRMLRMIHMTGNSFGARLVSLKRKRRC